LPRRERIRIAFVLSAAVLQYGSLPASWFQERWRCKDICFFVDSDHQYHSQDSDAMDPYITTLFENNTSEPESSYQISPAKDDRLFSLAVVLTEIAFGTVLANIQDKKKISGSPKDIMWEFLKMREIIKSGMLMREIGRKYANVVESCMDYDFRLGKAAGVWTNEVQKAYYGNVVGKLEECIRSFDEE
jgi:hypothetical protein